MESCAACTTNLGCEAIMESRRTIPLPPPSDALNDDEEPPDPGRVLHPARLSRSAVIPRPKSYPRDLGARHAPAGREPRHLPTRLDRVEVVVLYTPVLASQGWNQQELLADQETAQVAQHVAAVLENHARNVAIVPCGSDIASCLAALNPDRQLIFNLCEGQLGRQGSEAQAARLMSEHGFTHTGASYAAIARTANKWTTKKLLQAAGLPTPEYQIVRRSSDWKQQIAAPLIVKPIAEDGSIGITQNSLARTNDEILPLIKHHLRKFRQAVLVEEFVEGREINVAMWGNGSPSLLPIAEIEFTWTDDPLQKFVTYASKWVSDSPEFDGTPGVCPANLPTPDRKKDRTNSAASLASPAALRVYPHRYALA